MRCIALVLFAVVWMAVAAPDAWGANRVAFTDESGDACCTEDIQKVVVSTESPATAGLFPAQRRNGAAQESNLPSLGLPDLTGFEDRSGHRALPLRARS